MESHYRSNWYVLLHWLEPSSMRAFDQQTPHLLGQERKNFNAWNQYQKR